MKNPEIRVFEPEEYDIDCANSRLWCSSKKPQADKTSILITYAEVRRIGYVILALKCTNSREPKYYPGQKFFFKLIRKPAKPSIYEYGKMPPCHFVEYDGVAKKARICGSSAAHNGIGMWVSKAEGTLPLPQPNSINYDDPQQTIQDRILEKSVKDYHIKTWFENITDIPVLMTDDGRVVCIPKLRDEPNFACIGLKGSGKTLLAHSILDRMFWKWHKKVAICNDFLRETQSWSHEWEHGLNRRPAWVDPPLTKLTERTVGLPIIYLHPQNSILKNTIRGSHTFALNTQKIINDWNYYFQGSEWELGKSLKYIKEYSKEISECKTIDDLENKFEEIIPAKL